jgi:uncharacterized protein with von Willebrand factor type A (vWA) domain
MAEWMEANSGHSFFYNLLLFGRVLREVGVEVDPGRMVDAARALEQVSIGSRDDFFYTLRGVLVRRREDLPLFERTFALFWRTPVNGRRLMELRTQGEVHRSNRPQVVAPPLRIPVEPPAFMPPQKEQEEDEPPLVEATFTYSQLEVLRHKDFSELDEVELAAIRRMMAHLEWQPQPRRTRRYRPGDGPWLDLRHTFRRAQRYGGEVMEWPQRENKYKPRRLVILADISGSMERYTRLLLHFMYSLSRGSSQKALPVETFAFSTRLTRITRPLCQPGRQVEQVLRAVSQQVADWSGGTRIGEALKAFNYTWLRRVAGRGAVVLLISDGWDRGDAELLQKEMARLQRSCYRLVWLNPLIGSEGYEPLTRGMQAALPYIDDFLPVRNLASLEDLALHLRQGLQGARPLRRQVIKLNF